MASQGGLEGKGRREGEHSPPPSFGLQLTTASPVGVWRRGPGAHDLGGLRLPLQVHHAAAEQGRVQPDAQRAGARGGLLHGGDGELRHRLPLLLHGAALLAQPLRERVEDGETQETGTRAPQGRLSGVEAGWGPLLRQHLACAGARPALQ